MGKGKDPFSRRIAATFWTTPELAFVSFHFHEGIRALPTLAGNIVSAVACRLDPPNSQSVSFQAERIHRIDFGRRRRGRVWRTPYRAIKMAINVVTNKERDRCDNLAEG